MGKVLWKKRNEIAEIAEAVPTIKPYTQGSSKDFRPPSTIESDFIRLLEHDIPHVNFTYELVHDWYNRNGDGCEPIYIRAQQTPIDWKSKIGNSDMSTNFKADHRIPIYKGDMVIREDGGIFLLNWNVQYHPNNQATQAIDCNTSLTVKRKRRDETDADGFLIQKAGWDVILEDMPCVHSEYAGRPDYTSSQGMPGIGPDHLITVYMQWNQKSKDIRINDEFVIGVFTYRVINVSIAEVSADQLNGVLTLNAKRVAGGVIDDEGV